MTLPPGEYDIFVGAASIAARVKTPQPAVIRQHASPCPISGTISSRSAA